jgi:hypothetical protein
MARAARAEPPVELRSIVQHRRDLGALRSSRSFDKTRTNWATLCLRLRVKTLQLTVWNPLPVIRRDSVHVGCRSFRASASIESRASRVFLRGAFSNNTSAGLTSPATDSTCIFFREACRGSSLRAWPVVHPPSWTRASSPLPMPPATQTRGAPSGVPARGLGARPWLKVAVVEASVALAMRLKVGRCRSRWAAPA